MDGKSCKILSCFLVVLFLFASCKKEPEAKVVPPVNTANRTFVICEGNLGNGDASLGMYLAEKDSFYHDVFQSVNGQQLGDVFQSMQLIGDKYFLCVNNSDKIVVLNKTDLKIVGTIAIPKPRYILPISASKAYVSSIFNDKVYIVDPQTLQIKGDIKMPAQNAEGMTLWNDKAIVCTWDTTMNKIYFVNTQTDVVEKEVTIVAIAPKKSLFDNEGMLWVLSGNVTKGVQSYWTRLNPSIGTILKTFSFPPKADAVRPVMNAAKDSLYFIEVNYSGGASNNGIYRMNINATSLPTQSFISSQPFQYFWALDIDNKTGNVFVGDPKGFVQKGSVSIYQPDGTLVKAFKTGVGPGHFYFE